MLQTIQSVFRKVFHNETLDINEATSEKDIKMWDSLTHLELISAIEEAFNVTFSFEEVMSFITVNDILTVISRKQETES